MQGGQGAASVASTPGRFLLLTDPALRDGGPGAAYWQACVLFIGGMLCGTILVSINRSLGIKSAMQQFYSQEK
jgi:hypothetical protein